MDARRGTGADVRLVRIFNTYGPRMALSDGRVVSNFIVRALSHQPIEPYGDGRQSRSFYFVSDLIEGLFRASTSQEFDSPINLGNPVEHTMIELAHLVMEVADRSVELVYQPLPPDDPQRRCPNINKARQLLGFAPSLQLREGLRATCLDFASRLQAVPRSDPRRTLH